jgi:hypothetical protein
MPVLMNLKAKTKCKLFPVNTMKAYIVGIEVLLYSFSTLALDGGVW